MPPNGMTVELRHDILKQAERDWLAGLGIEQNRWRLIEINLRHLVCISVFDIEVKISIDNVLK